MVLEEEKGMNKKMGKTLLLSLALVATLATGVNAVSFSSVGIGDVWWGKNAYTGANSANWALAEISWGNSVKTLDKGDPKSPTLTSIWVQTDYIAGFGGTPTSHHTACDVTNVVNTWTTQD